MYARINKSVAWEERIYRTRHIYGKNDWKVCFKRLLSVSVIDVAHYGMTVTESYVMIMII